MADLKETPSQTAGPYVHIGLATESAGFSAFPSFGTEIAGPDVAGERIRIEGTIIDGDGALMTDALLEIWQADAEGRYADPEANHSFTGFGRAAPDFDSGVFSFETIKPGSVDGAAPHLALWLVARGINLGLHTRLYFDDEPSNASDPVLSMVDDTRRTTLIAHRQEATTPPVYRFDIRVQGKDETVFFDV